MLPINTQEMLIALYKALFSAAIAPFLGMFRKIAGVIIGRRKEAIMERGPAWQSKSSEMKIGRLLSFKLQSESYTPPAVKPTHRTKATKKPTPPPDNM
jgi:hypothetical protein